MTELIEAAIAKLGPKGIEQQLDKSIKYVVDNTSAILLDGSGAKAVDVATEADLTVSADSETFQGLLDGSENPTFAFMQGKIQVDGDMMLAMKMDSLLR